MKLLGGIFMVVLSLLVGCQAQDAAAKLKEQVFNSQFLVRNVPHCVSRDGQVLPITCNPLSMYQNSAQQGSYIEFSFGKTHPIGTVKLITRLRQENGFAFKPFDVFLKFGDGAEKVYSLSEENTYIPTFKYNKARSIIFLKPPICTDSVILRPVTTNGDWSGQPIDWITFHEESSGSCRRTKAPQGMRKLDLSGRYCLSAPIISKSYLCQNAFDGNMETRWATNRGAWSWITVYLKKEMRVGAVSFVDVSENIQELSVRTFHFFAKRVLMTKSSGTVEIPSEGRHPSLTVEIKITKVKHNRNTGFNEISVWVED